MAAIRGDHENVMCPVVLVEGMGMEIMLDGDMIREIVILTKGSHKIQVNMPNRGTPHEIDGVHMLLMNHLSSHWLRLRILVMCIRECSVFASGA